MKTALHRASKPAKKTSKKRAKKTSLVRDAVVVAGAAAVAIAVGNALMRKPRVNPALAAMFRANRDLLPK